MLLTKTQHTRAGMSTNRTLEDAYAELQGYTLSLGDTEFVHQHVVDAWAAQTADENTKPIGITFALIGLYLHVEKGFTGRQVQRVHMLLGNARKDWPRFSLPENRGNVTVEAVMDQPPGEKRNRAIGEWCRSVWATFSKNRSAVVALLDSHDIG